MSSGKVSASTPRVRWKGNEIMHYRETFLFVVKPALVVTCQISGVFFLQKPTLWGFLQFQVKVLYIVDGINWIYRWKETKHRIPTAAVQFRNCLTNEKYDFKYPETR